MLDSEPRNGTSDHSVNGMLAGLLDLTHSIKNAHPQVQKLVDGVQLASVAAKGEDHPEALALLMSHIVGPILDGFRSEIRRLITESMQKAIGNRFTKLVSDEFRQRLSTINMEQLIQDVLAGHVDERKRLENHVEQLATSLQTLTNTITRVAENGSAEVTMTIAASGFAGRLSEQASVKAEIGRRVAELFFKTHRRPSYVMASSTAVHFAQELRKCNGVLGTMFMTNSIVFPLAALNDCSPHEVIPFYGPIYDDQCGGWLPVIGNELYFAGLRNCFRLESYALTTALLTPWKLSVDHGMCFTRTESAKIARTLTECATDIILMVPADRVCQSLDIAEKSGAISGWSAFRSANKSIHAVIAGKTRDHDIVRVVHEFAAQGINVHLQTFGASDWEFFPAVERS